MKKKQEKSSRRFIIITIAIVVVICAALGIMTININKTNKENEARLHRLEELLANEEIRSKALEDEEAYIKTKNYIEEKARSIGFVYPDEIFFRKNDQ